MDTSTHASAREHMPHSPGERKVLAAALLLTCLASGCNPPPSSLSESDIPTWRALDVEYDESRLNVSNLRGVPAEQERIVLAVSRASTARYIEARSSDGLPPPGGLFQGSLNLHEGWREEFFPIEKEAYEGTYPLPAGTLYFDPSPTSLSRDIGYQGMVRGVTDRFTGFLTKVIEVPRGETYTFGVDSNDGTIGILQSLTDGMHYLQVLWYDWYPQSMAGRLSEVDVALTAGTYLLTVHYFEVGGRAGYHVASPSQRTAPPPPFTLSEGDIPTSQSIDVDYDEGRLRVSSDRPLSFEQQRIVRAVGRATTARYIEARSSDGVHPPGGLFQGSLSLHEGWREEFFPIAKEAYEVTYPLPAGVLYFEPRPTGISRSIGSRGMVQGVFSMFTGFLTKVIEVPSDETYTFGVDSDDGTIGTLQKLTDDMHDLRVLWYEWHPQSMSGRLSEVDVALTAGTYLLTVHYFEVEGQAGYRVDLRRSTGYGVQAGGVSPG
jgi:Ni,Fe-hydrogenase III component G